MSFKPAVRVFGEDKFHHNNLAFETREEAEISARDLANRWMLVEDWRVDESDQPANYRLVDGELISLEEVNHGA